MGLELVRIGAGFGYAVIVYFARTGAPDPAVTRAARLTTPVRVAGLAAAGNGRRRAGDALVGTGSVASLVAVARSVRAVARQQRRGPARPRSHDRAPRPR